MNFLMKYWSYFFPLVIIFFFFIHFFTLISLFFFFFWSMFNFWNGIVSWSFFLILSVLMLTVSFVAIEFILKQNPILIFSCSSKCFSRKWKVLFSFIFSIKFAHILILVKMFADKEVVEEADVKRKYVIKVIKKSGLLKKESSNFLLTWNKILIAKNVNI